MPPAESHINSYVAQSWEYGGGDLKGGGQMEWLVIK